MPRSSKSTRSSQKARRVSKNPTVCISIAQRYIFTQRLPNSKEANKFNFPRICRIRLIIVRSERAAESRQFEDGRWRNEESQHFHPSHRKNSAGYKRRQYIRETRRKRTEALVTWQQTVFLGSVDDTARRNASFSWDLCPSSSQWLIGEVFTALARMEHSLIAQLQITVMFLSDASATHFLKESPERYFFQGLSVFVGPEKRFWWVGEGMCIDAVLRSTCW